MWKNLKTLCGVWTLGKSVVHSALGPIAFFQRDATDFTKKGLKGTNAAKETRDWTAPRLERQRSIASSSQAEEALSVTPHFRLESQNKSHSLVLFGSTNI